MQVPVFFVSDRKRHGAFLAICPTLCYNASVNAHFYGRIEMCTGCMQCRFALHCRKLESE